MHIGPRENKLPLIPGQMTVANLLYCQQQSKVSLYEP